MDENTHNGTRLNLIIAGSILAATLIICTLIGASTLIKVRSLSNTIRVTGAAFKPIKSDYAIWDANVSARAETLESAYSKLESDLKKVKTFFENQGISDTSYSLRPVRINKHMNREGQIIAYTLVQTFHIEMPDVEKVKSLSEKASVLIEQGVMIESRPPKYLVTSLDDLKIEMIRAATENAKMRAEQLAGSTGHKIGAPTSANVGVFQIRALHSQDVSSRGMSDVSSINKEIVSTVHVRFLIE